MFTHVYYHYLDHNIILSILLSSAWRQRPEYVTHFWGEWSVVIISDHRTGTRETGGIAIPNLSTYFSIINKSEIKNLYIFITIYNIN